MNKARAARLVALAAAAGCAITLASAQNGNAVGNPHVTPAEHSDHIQSLRGLMPRPDDFTHGNRQAPLHGIPSMDGPGFPEDGATQGATTFAAGATAGLGFDGVGNGMNGFTVQYAPPDTVGAVGRAYTDANGVVHDGQYVQVVNVGLAVFDKKTGAVQLGPIPTKTLWQGFGGACEADDDGDAVVLYDKIADRWIVSQFAVTAAPYYQCVAVSQTPDATGGWNRYSYNYGTVFPDYPKMGVWPDGYYISFNMFNNGQTFAGAKVCAYDRASMLAGAPAAQQCFQLSTSYGGLLPSDLDGVSSGGASGMPPAGAPNYFLNKGASTLNLWRFHVDWANSANTKLTGPVSIPVASFTSACSGGTCIPQSGTSQKLDSLADRLMYRLAYRNFGSYESLVVTHSVNVGTSRKAQHAGVRWYEIRNPGGTPQVAQQSTFSPDGNFRWMGSIAQDKQGNMALGYSVSSSTMHPAIRYTARAASDPASTMGTEASVVEGTGSQLANLSRWGDYSAMTLDPDDDCTFWFTSEYLKANGTWNWSTRIASFRFPSCQ